MFLLSVTVFLLIIRNFSCDENVCYRDDLDCVDKKELRYLFYDINPPEGFNLRRDVYLRFAVLAHKMQQSRSSILNNFKLVLPPWSYLIHWGYSEHPQYIPWGLYFDLKSLQMFAPVIEMHEFFSDYPNKYSKVVLDELYTLQHFEDMFESGNFEDRMEISECLKKYEHTFFYYSNITAKTVNCLSYHGPATKLSQLFLNTTAQTILIEHAEVALHDFFGSKLYWQARRSMRFSKELKNIANDYRNVYLSSSDENDNTVLPDNWKDEQPRRNAFGGPYVAIHLRRGDFVRSRPNEAPPLHSVKQQITKVLNKLKLNTVFVATDGPPEEFDKLSRFLPEYTLVKYNPSVIVRKKYGEGGIAIIDQIICSYARYFIGTHESTFSFRIQEEREIIGFPTNSTFNALCKEENKCHKPSVWNIVY